MQGDTGVQGDTGGYGGTTRTGDTPTLQQALETAYFQAVGDRDPADGFIPEADLYSEQHVTEGIGDTLLEFLLREIAFDDAGDGPNTENHWSQACWRMDQIVNEVTSVRNALYRHCPE